MMGHTLDLATGCGKCRGNRENQKESRLPKHLSAFWRFIFHQTGCGTGSAAGFAAESSASFAAIAFAASCFRAVSQRMTE